MYGSWYWDPSNWQPSSNCDAMCLENRIPSTRVANAFIGEKRNFVCGFTSFVCRLIAVEEKVIDWWGFGCEVKVKQCFVECRFWTKSIMKGLFVVAQQHSAKQPAHRAGVKQADLFLDKSKCTAKPLTFLGCHYCTTTVHWEFARTLGGANASSSVKYSETTHDWSINDKILCHRWQKLTPPLILRGTTAIRTQPYLSHRSKEFGIISITVKTFDEASPAKPKQMMPWSQCGCLHFCRTEEMVSETVELVRIFLRKRDAVQKCENLIIITTNPTQLTVLAGHLAPLHTRLRVCNSHACTL